MTSVSELPVEALQQRLEAAARSACSRRSGPRLQPDRVAIYDYTGQDRTFGELNANANRVARLLRGAGLKAGDSVALACSQPGGVLRRAVRRPCAPGCAARRSTGT